MFAFIKELKSNCDAWNDNSLEPIIFGKLIKESGNMSKQIIEPNSLDLFEFNRKNKGLSEEIISLVIDILKTCLNPSKDVQLRTRFLLLIPDIFVGEMELSKSMSHLEKSIEVIINDMIVPNIVWKAGRSAGAVRMSAIASLALLIQTNTVKHIKVNLSTLEQLVKLMVSILDDDNKNTRLYVCKIYLILLKNFGNILEKDLLHKLYPEFIKRLDDQNEDIRFEILNVFWVYLESLNVNYDKILYQAHLQMIFENILLYLDDSNADMQLKVFSKFV